MLCIIPTIAKTQELRGTLLAKSGDRNYPVPGAELRLCSRLSGKCLLAYSISEGLFRFSDLSPGKYILATSSVSNEIDIVSNINQVIIVLP
jgi:hypothetical protein